MRAEENKLPIIAGDVQVSVSPNPFLVKRYDHCVEAGISIADIVAKVIPNSNLWVYIHVNIDDMYIERQNWTKIYPKAGAIVQINALPMGGRGGGKNPLRTIISLAVMASTSFIGGALAGTALGQASIFGISASKIITGAISFAGRLAMSALAPPARQSSKISAVKDTPTMFIQGAKNQILPFGIIPQILGKHRVFPPMGARPYTETIGNEQYLRMLFIWGYGPLDISDLKIGETPLEEFTGVEIEHRYGFADDVDISLYSNTVIQNDMQLALKQADGYQIRTTELDADEISIDITFPRGLMILDANGNRVKKSVQLEVQYSPAGANDWSAGMQGYKYIAQQNTGNLEAPGSLNVNSPYRYYKRIDRLVIDKATGIISVIKGERKSGFDINGNAAGADNEVNVPIVPDTKIKIAKLVHVGDNIFIDIIDERDLSLVGEIFQNTSDFTPSLNFNGNSVDIAAGNLKFNGIEITAMRGSAIRKSVRFAVPKGQYDVRVRRITADSNSTSVFDETVWSAIRTIRHESPVNMKGLAMTALRIKATDQLNGIIDRFNGVVTSIVKDWDSSNWTEAATSNPASLFRHVLQGSANARPLPDSRIDIAQLEDWHTECKNSGREFNAVIDYNTSVRDVLLAVAAAGRASPSVIDGKWGVVIDRPKSVPVQHFTSRNSFDFQGERIFEDLPHALRIRFANREQAWQQDEMLVFDDGYDKTTATKFETLDLIGITDPKQIWKDGRYHIATARLRSEIYSFSADIENIICTRGDLIKFTHDVPLFGISSARIKKVTDDGVNVISVEIDEMVEMQAGKEYSVRFRKQDGTSMLQDIVTVAGEANILNFKTPFALVNAPSVGDLVMFGEAGKESVDLIVQSIKPMADLTAKITCVDAATAIHSADSGTIPNFESNLTIPKELQRPPAPVISDIQSGAEVMVIDNNGNISPRIVISLEPVEDVTNTNIVVLIKNSEESEFQKAEFSFTNGKVVISEITTGSIYDIKLSYIKNTAWVSEETIIANYQVEGASGLPTNIDNFQINILGSMAHLTWDRSKDIDIDYYQLRFASDVSGYDWESAVILVDKIPPNSTSVTVPANSGAYMIKAVDMLGQYSQNATVITSNIVALINKNQVAIIDENPSFNGIKNNLVLVDDKLRLNGADSIDDWANLDDVQSMALGENGLVANGSYNFATSFDLGAIYTATISADMNISAVDLSTVIDQWNMVDSIDNWDSSDAINALLTELEIRTTDDDPNDVNAVWSNWQNFVIGNYKARGFDFRLNTTSSNNNITPIISKLAVTIDMPDKILSGENIVSNISGTTVNFAGSFKNIPAIAISAQNMATGDYYTINNITSNGFEITFFDSSDIAISRIFDYIAKGY